MFEACCWPRSRARRTRSSSTWAALAPRWYGILLAVGILIAILVTRRQLALRGRDPGLAGEVAVWAVPCGVVGARLYHVATDWSAFSGNLEKIPLIQEGGLGHLRRAARRCARRRRSARAAPASRCS